MIKAIIMAGGEGTRLRPLTCNRAKPMIPIMDKPVIEHAINLLKKHNIHEIVISLFYLPENVQNYFGDGSDWDVNITYSVEETPLGTAGGVKQAIGSHDDTFIVLSGDGIIDFNISEILDFHKKKKSPFTIVLNRVKEPTEYGIVITDENGKIDKFLEKPAWSEVFTDTANTGMYVIDPKIMAKYVPENEKFDFSFDLFPLLQKNKVNLYGFVADGYWCDVGNLISYKKAHTDILEGVVEIDIPGKTMGENIWIGKNVEIDPEAKVKGPVFIGDFVRIKKGADISDFSVIGSNSIIEEGSSIRRSIILNSTIIAPKCEVRGAVIGKRCVLEENVSIYEGSVISDDCQIGSGAEIPSNIRVWPDKFIEANTRLTTDLIWGQTEKKLLFSADGITGSFNVKINPEFASKLGSAIGAYLGDNSRIAISRDASDASRIIKRAITSGLLSMGVAVFDMEIESIPINRYASRFMDADMGLHVQVSPMTGLQFITIKIFDKNGFRLPLNNEKKVENIFFRGDYPRKSAFEVGKLYYPTHYIESYINNTERLLNSKILRNKNWNIIVDCFHGSASHIFPDLLAYYNCDITVLRGQIKHSNSNVESIKDDTLQALKKIQQMCKSNKEIGVMIGPNGEHIKVVDEMGELLHDNDINSLLCIFYLKHKKTQTINIPVTASRKLEDIAEKYKGQVKRISTKTRSPETSDDVFSGGDIGRYPHLEIDYDPMITFLILLEFASIENSAIYELRKEVPPTNIHSVAIPCSVDEKAAIMHNLSDTKDETIEMIDGIRIVRDDSWILVLPDASQPLIHLYAEGNTIEARDAILKEYTVRIKKLKGMNK